MPVCNAHSHGRREKELKGGEVFQNIICNTCQLEQSGMHTFDNKSNVQIDIVSKDSSTIIKQLKIYLYIIDSFQS